jgi:hypothetical protein
MTGHSRRRPLPRQPVRASNEQASGPPRRIAPEILAIAAEIGRMLALRDIRLEREAQERTGET